MSAPRLSAVTRTIAIYSHAGDRNKHDGEIYLLHVSRVAEGARSLSPRYGLDPELAEAVGWLHDVVEDTVTTLANIHETLALTEPGKTVKEITLAVDLLTKRDLSLEDYYTRIKDSELAVCVKMSDMTDNFRRNHKIVDEAKRLKMAEKYSLGMDILSG